MRRKIALKHPGIEGCWSRTLSMRTSHLVDQIMEHTFFRREIDNKSTVVDLGMNDGRFAREMHEKFGCKVIGVEANPHWACKLTNSDSITCHNLAISASTGNVKFLIADDDE